MITAHQDAFGKEGYLGIIRDGSVTGQSTIGASARFTEIEIREIRVRYVDGTTVGASNENAVVTFYGKRRSLFAGGTTGNRIHRRENYRLIVIDLS